MITAIWNIWLELAPWLLLGAAVGGLLHVLVPAGWLQRQLSGRLGVLKAVLLGIPMPLCSCGVIPVGLGLRKHGASRGAVVGFLISTPQTGVDSILVSGSFLGWPFAILKVGVALVTGLVGGTLADLADSAAPESTERTEPQTTTPGHWLKEAVSHGLELIEMIWGWLVIGVLVSAAITWLLPADSLSDVQLLSGFPALLITLLVSLPLYVCATASVPIAAALVASGLPPGAALVFLMAGPATNVATLGAVYRTLGRNSLIVYLVTLVIGSIVAGMAFNQVIDPGMVSLHHHDHSSGWWRVLSGVVLALLIGWYAFRDLRQWIRHRLASSSADSAAAVIVKVDGMTCNGCAARLTRTLESHADIKRAEVSFDEAEARVFGSASNETIGDLTTQAGFRVRQ